MVAQACTRRLKEEHGVPIEGGSAEETHRAADTNRGRSKAFFLEKQKGSGREVAGPQPLCTYTLNKRWAASIKDKLVGIEHLSAIKLELDITQVWIIDHGPKVCHQ